MLASGSASASRQHAAVHGAVGHSSQHARGFIRSNYALQHVIILPESGRHQLQLHQPRGLQEYCTQQQQTLWLPLEHHALLQSQIEPAHRIQQQVLRLQQKQEQQTGHSKQCSVGASSGSANVCSVPVGSSHGVQRALMVTALAAAGDVTAQEHPPTTAIDSTSVVGSSSHGAGVQQQARRRLSASAPQSVSAAEKASASAADANGKSDDQDRAHSATRTKIINSSSDESSSRSKGTNNNIRTRLQQQLASRTARNSSDSAGSASNDSNISAVLQQLQQKLGQRFSPKAPQQHTPPPSAGKTKQPSKQQQQQEHVIVELQTSPAKHKSSNSRQRRTSPARLLRPVPQSSAKVVKDGQKFVQFSGGKIKSMYPDQQHTGPSLLQLQQSTATPLAELQKVLDSAAAPEPVRLRLIWDWRCSPRMPPDLKALQQQLLPFGQMTELLGGVDSATEILSTDSTYMVMQMQQLQERLLHLQQLLSAVQVSAMAVLKAEATAEPSRASRAAATAAAARVNSGKSSLAAIRQRLTSRHQQPTAAAVLSAASLQTGSSSNSREGSESMSEATSSSSSSSSSTLAVKEEALTLVRCSPGILWLSPEELQGKLAGLQQALALQSAQDVLQIMRLQPHLLSADEARLEAKVTALATSLQLPVARACSLLLKQPLLLNLSAETLAQRVPDLAEVLGLPHQMFVKLVLAKPGVLFFSPKKMRAKSIRLQCIAATHQHWAAELKVRLSPGSLVQLLTVGDKRLMRAEYLVAMKAQHKQSMLYTVQVQSDQAFMQKFPGFEEWHRQRNQQSSQAAEAK